MTSRQPETMPGTAGHAAIPSSGDLRGNRRTGAARHRLSSAPRRPVLVLPPALLIIVGLAGVRGRVTGPRWDGPLHGDALAVGLALEVVLGIMLVIAIRRLAGSSHAGTVEAAPASAAAVKLRRALVLVISAAMIAVALTVLVGLHQHVFSRPARARPGQAVSPVSASSATRPGRHFSFPHVHVTAVLLYGLLILVFLGAVGVSIWARRFRRSSPIRNYRYLAKDSRDLLEAVESGRSALRAVDDARAAIIACYLAMEASLAERGAARAIADTPNELLMRATAIGIVRGTAAARLTALFYEARFSSHRLDREHRDAAGQALGDLAAALGEAEAPGTRAGRSRTDRSPADRSPADQISVRA